MSFILSFIVTMIPIPDGESIAAPLKVFEVVDEEGQPLVSTSHLSTLFTDHKPTEAAVIAATQNFNAALIRCGFPSLRGWIRHVLSSEKDPPHASNVYER